MRRARRSAERRLIHRGACQKGEQFVVASKSFPQSEGCYSQGAQYNDEAIYSPPAADNAPGNYLVGATQGDKNDPDDFRWSLIYADAKNPKDSFSLCQSVQTASTTHPASAMWACDTSGDGQLTIVNNRNFSVTCGCPSSGADITTRLDPPTSRLRSRAVVCGVVFVFGVISLCCALAYKIAGGRKKFRQQPKYTRVGTTEESV